MSMHMIQLQLDPEAFVRFLQSIGLNRKEDEDLGYGVHAWLASMFGDLAPKPFRLFMAAKDHRPPKILCYAQNPASILIERAKSFAQPFALSVCDLDKHIASRPMPDRMEAGARFRFEVLICPVGRKSRSGIEKDIFLIHADADASKELTRIKVYGDWLTEQLQTAGQVEKIELKAFRLVTQIRRSTTASRSKEKLSPLIRPQALMSGILKVMDAEAFRDTLVRGIGRHRAFGYGMLLLGPV